jgi:hypothetical protein
VTLRSLLRASVAVALCLLLAVPSFPQTGYGNIGPSKGEVVAIIVAAAVVLTGIGILVYYEVHKHAPMVGCVVSDQNGLSLRTQKDNKIYPLSGDSADLHPGQQVGLKVKKTKDSTGKITFEVQKLAKSYGECKP